MKLIFEVHCRSIELNNERDVQSKRTRQYVNARIWSEKKQSWKEKKDQGREESPSYDQHVKPRKKNGKLFWKQSSELVSRLAVFVWKTCARRLLADWFFPVSLDLSFKKWWDFFNIYGKRGKRWQYSVILWEKQIPCSQPMQKVSLFCVQMAKTDVKMRNSLGQPRSFIMGHLHVPDRTALNRSRKGNYIMFSFLMKSHY